MVFLLDSTCLQHLPVYGNPPRLTRCPHHQVRTLPKLNIYHLPQSNAPRSACTHFCGYIRISAARQSLHGRQQSHLQQNGLALTELFEGDILTAYQDAHGIWTIGYGHTAGVYPGQTITQEQAVAYLFSDIRAAADCVNQAVTVRLAQSQFDALVDFAFNVGITNFRHSTLLRDVNAGRFPQAIAQFRLWDHCGGIVSAGLLRRRNAEAAEFNSDTPIGDVSASIAFA